MIEAGRQTDLWVAIEVMGATWTHDPTWPGGPADILTGGMAERGADGVIRSMWCIPYSTDRVRALEVVDRLIEATGKYFDVSIGPQGTSVGIGGLREYVKAGANGAPAVAFPLAVCRLALDSEVLAHLKRAEQHPEAE